MIIQISSSEFPQRVLLLIHPYTLQVLRSTPSRSTATYRYLLSVEFSTQRGQKYRYRSTDRPRQSLPSGVRILNLTDNLLHGDGENRTSVIWAIPAAARSKAERLLGLRVRIPQGARMFVSCKVFVLSGRGLCDGPIPRPEESYRMWCVSECDQEKINNLDTYCE
jgi:hypothetical protein